MALGEWLTRFRALHGRARSGTLQGADAAAYVAARDELARALLTGQRLTAPAGVPPRRFVRVARALQADLEFDDGTVRVATLDVCAGGFATRMAKPPGIGEEPSVRLRLPGREPLVAKARVVDAKMLVGYARVAFQFTEIGAAEVEALELFVFDAVLQELESAR